MRKPPLSLLLAIVLLNEIVLAEAPLTDPRDTQETAADKRQAEELAKVQGKWSRSMRTRNGTYRVVKEHKGNKTTVQILNAEGEVVAAKESQFTLEVTDKVRIFTFFNNVITDGPGKGQVDKSRKSYIFRVQGDQFFEAKGLLVGDDAEPSSFVWKRVKD